jgi:tetratricopeptide (TPR) repeat protein
MNHDRSKTHYEVLQVDRRASHAVIQGAYRALLKTARNHPDLGGTEADAQAINAAFGVLGNATARADYDRELEALHPALGFHPPVVRTQYILICPTCRRRNQVDDPRALERKKCGACGALLLPTRRMPMETDHARAFRLGIYLFDKGLMARSVSEFEAAVRVQPATAKYHYWLGRSLYQLHRFPRARQAFQSAATLSPERFHFQFWLGQISYALRDYHDAVQSFSAAQKVRPRHAPTLLRLASCYFHLGDYRRAVRVLEHAISREPTRLQLYTLLGVVYLASRNRGAALQAFRHAEQINPGDALTRRYLNLIQQG